MFTDPTMLTLSADVWSRVPEEEYMIEGSQNSVACSGPLSTDRRRMPASLAKLPYIGARS